MGEKEKDHLKDMVFRGAFLVALVYILVFLYNSGLLDKLRRPDPKLPFVPSAVNGNVNESRPMDQPIEDGRFLPESTNSAKEETDQ